MRKCLLLLFVLSLVLAAGSSYAVTELLGNTSFVDPAPSPADWQGDSWGSPGTFITTGIPAGAPSAHVFTCQDSGLDNGTNNMYRRTVVASAQTLGQAVGGATIYRMSAWFYVPSTDMGGAAMARAYMRINLTTAGRLLIMDNQNQQVRNTSGGWTAQDLTLPTDVWTYKAVDFTLPVDTLGYVAFGVHGFADTTTTVNSFRTPKMYIDDVSLVADPLPSYTITASAGANGSIDPSGAVKVYQGGSQTFDFLGNSGYVPDQVTIDGGTPEAAGASYTFTDVQAAHSISVTFKTSSQTYTITASAGAGGSINPSGAVSVPINGNQKFDFLPNPGYYADQLTIDGGAPVPAGASYTFTRVTTTHTISVTFKALTTFIITASAGTGGTIDPSGAVNVIQGTDKKFDFLPAPGYIPVLVTIDSGTPEAAGASYTFTNVQANHTIDVTFAQLVNVSGKVTNIVTGPAVGVKVIITSPDLPGQTWTATTVAGGLYSVNVQAGLTTCVADIDPTNSPMPVLLTALVDRTKLFPYDEGGQPLPLTGMDLDIAPYALVTGISGVVRDSVTNLPIGDAVVQVGGKNGPAALTNAAGEYSVTGIAAAFGFGDLYADAVGYAGKLTWVTGAGNLGCDILLDPNDELVDTDPVTPGVQSRSYNGDMEDLDPPFKPTQWTFVPWNGADTSIDWSASPDAKNGDKSLFYCYNATRLPVNEYAGIYKIIQLAPGYDYNFWFSAKADLEVKRWQPLVEFMDALDGNWNGFISSDPAYYEYSHMPPYDWYPYFRWMDRGGTKNGAPVRFTPTPLQTVVKFIFLYEPDDLQLPDRLPPAGKGCYIDDLVLDAVPQHMTYTVVAGTVIPFGITGTVISPSEFSVALAGDIDNQLELVSGGGNGWNGNQLGPWFRYPEFWNQWYYDGTYNAARRKVVDIGFKYRRLNPALEGSVDIWINWSTPEWSATPGSQLAPPLSDFGPGGVPYVGRVKVATLPIGALAEYTYSLTGYDLARRAGVKFNPQWVSIDVRGFNTQIWNGTLKHKCVSFPKRGTGIVDEKFQEGICNAVVQVGVGGPTAATDCDGKYAITGITPAAGVALYADALGNADVTETIDTTGAVSGWFGTMTKDVTLTAKDETDYSYVQNGGFENVVAGKPVGWGVGLAGAANGPGSGTQSYLTADATNPACGTYSAKFLPIIQNYEGVVQFIPVVAGSKYNLYWKAKSDTGVRGAWTWIYWTNDAGDEMADLYNNWNWWAAPTVWTQYPGTIAACGDNWTGAYAPIVGVVPPVGATRMYLYFGCESPDPPGGDIWPWDGGSFDIDGVVVDRVGPVAPVRYLISSSAGAHGNINPTPDVFVNAGADQTFTIIPDAGYVVDTLTVDGLAVPAALSYTFHAVTANHTIAVTFKTAPPVGPVYGTNNRSALTDGKLIGKNVKVWGQVISIDAGPPASYVIDDGYGTGVKINGTPAVGLHQMAVVVGVVQANHSVTP